MESTKVLVVDDEPDLVALLREWLEEEGYQVVSASTGEEGLRLFFEQRPDLSIVDLRMPGMDGFQLVGRIREMSEARVLVLSALGGEEQVVRGLELGADEYLVKPVTKRAFLARVRSHIRRAGGAEQATAGYADSNLSLSFLTHELQVRGQAVHLRPIEFRLLAFLVQNRDRLLNHHEILDQVWGDPKGSLDSLKWYISSLREKVEETPKRPRLILTVPKVGYRYLPPDPYPVPQPRAE